MLPTNADELATAKAYYDTLARKAIALGGTVSAEHGIGKTKRHYLSWMVGQETLSQFRALKRHLDPSWVLGRDNLIDPVRS
jgi:D-lactate dehydrogenase (cytochrome)